jgi:putative hydrolase of the HAD superfamily
MPAESAADPDRTSPFRGLVIDWGGVMTNPIPQTVRAWLDAEEIDPTAYAAVMRPWVVTAYDPMEKAGLRTETSGAQAGAAYGGTAADAVADDGPALDGDNPIHALERGECTVEEFERLLASLLVCRDGRPVAPEGLLGRMFAATERCDPMYQAVYRARGAGLRTGLLSNSWGVGDYPRHLFPEMFDAVVISAEVGMRKPEERIFRHAAELLGLAPEECVFVDDLEANIAAAEAIGMTGVLHGDPPATVDRLAELFGLPLREAS